MDPYRRNMLRLDDLAVMYAQQHLNELHCQAAEERLARVAAGCRPAGRTPPFALIHRAWDALSARIRCQPADKGARLPEGGLLEDKSVALYAVRLVHDQEPGA